MKKNYLKHFLVSSLIILSSVCTFAQQVPNASFEDWSGEKFADEIQPKDWYVSNISQVGFNFNLAHREGGHSGSYSLMVQDTEVGAMGITEVSPGYFSLGKPWSYISGLDTKTATAGTSGGINFKNRPDSMSVWIKRTGNNVDKEDFYLLYYAWSGTAKGTKYKAKNGSCSSVSTQVNEESDIRQALDGNECGTDQLANQIAEGMWREKKQYGDWTNIRVPIYYLNNDVPTMMNIIFSASNYPNYRANSGLYEGNSLYVDDVELIYSSKIQKLYIGGKEWKGFDSNSTEEQAYSLGRSATTIPTIKAVRGAGSITNARGETVNFVGRELSGSEINIVNGEIDGAPTVITITSEDGKSSSTYKIKFVREASTNAKLANIYVNGVAINNFQQRLTNYNYTLPYGTTTIPVVTVEQGEDEQTVAITQANSLTGTATIVVTAADKKTTMTYTVNFSVALLADNTLQDIKVNGASVPGFTPNQTIYRISLPTSTTTIPEVEAVSAYPAGEQTITHTPPTSAAALDGSQHVITVTTPGNATPKTYKLNYKLEASSYALLNSLQMGDNWIPNFDPNTFSYYVNLPIGTTELPAITYEKGEATQTVTVQEGGINGVTKVTVVAGNGVDRKEYKIVVATETSSISTLGMIYVGGVALEGFDATKTSYTYSLPIGTIELPSITYDLGDEYQTVTVTPGGVNGTTRVAVTAENGSSTVYQITFSVAKATNATLKMIYLDGVALEGFDPNVVEYHCPLPQGTATLPAITYEKGDEYQTITTRDGGVNGDYKITVRPQSGAALTYTLHFSVATSDNANLKMIYLDGVALEGFDPNVLNYVDTLPMGVLTIPTVTFEKGDETQKVLNVNSNNVQTIKVTAESGTTQTYTIEFIIQRSNSAFLQMIYLDSVALDGFDKNIFDYTVTLQQPTCPKITVEKEEGQQVTITAPYSAGQAKIVVTPAAGEPNTYTVNFVNLSENYALLKNIYVDGQAVADFSPEQFTYSVICQNTQPVITYDADSTQTITEFRNKNIVTLYVLSGNSKAQYELEINTQANTDCTLRNITIDGVSIEAFSPSTYTYKLSVAAETTTPNIGFEKQYAQQVVYAGMLNANTYSLLVAAQSGDTARYTLHLDKQLSDNAELDNLQLQGMDIEFSPSTYEYVVSLPEGYELPNILVDAKEGQNVALHTLSETEQEVLVTAPSKKTNTYRIVYDRKKSANVWLADILIDGQSLEGFDPEVLNYTDTLPWRTKVVPCVQPIGSHKDQIITTYHSAIDGITRISVLAPDSTSTQEYTIHFPVIKSSNTALEFIELDHDIVSIDYAPNTTDYHIALPYGETQAPLVLYQAAEPEQTIQYISRPLGETSEIIVTAENGNKTTYKLHFAPTYASAANQLDSLHILIDDSVVYAQLDVKQTTHTVALPYGTRTMNVDFKKLFAEQTVWVQPGGVQSPTVITVKSNRPEEADVVYTITPQVAAQDPATLTDIQVNGTTIEGFDPNRFSYIVNVTSSPVITYTVAAGAQINILMQTNKHWKAQVTYNGRTNTYDLWYYYANDLVPNTEFTEWTQCATYTSAVKPTGWNTIADVLGKHSGFGSFTPDGLVSKSGNDAVYLKTPYSAPGGGNIPGFITLGTVAGKWGISGSSSFPISGGISFHNTPDQVAIRYYNKKVKNHSLIQYSLTGTQGVKTLEWTDSETSSNYKEKVFDLTEANTTAGDPTLLNITICSFYITHSETNTALNTLAEMYVDYLRFSYNSTLTGLKVNDSIAHMDGNAFSYTLPDSENTLLPTLTFTGEVADQAQLVVWSEETKADGFGVRNATITNYAEDGTSTEYTLELKRPLDIKNTLSDLRIDGNTIEGFASATDFTIHLASTIKHLPDIQPIASSSLQTITTNYADSTMTIVVTPELGEAVTYTIRFVTDLSDDVELTNINVEGAGITFDPAQKEYTISGDKLPAITFVKKMDGQTVVLNNGVLHVTAENGNIGIYTVLLNKPVVPSTGQLADIEADGISIKGFSSDVYEYELDKPKHVTFKRINDNDVVTFIETPDYMEWLVQGDEQHTYRINYPNVLSSNTSLKAIYIDSTSYDAFNPQIYDYVYATDQPVHIHAVANEKASKLDVSYQSKGDTLLYTYTVTAEDGTIGQPYTLAITPKLSNLKYLQSILLDGKPLADFRADKLEYNVVIPVGAYKATEPTIPTIEYIMGAPRQQVSIEHGGLGESTNIIVTAEDGSAESIYQLHFEAETSHCINLTGIAVNGKPIAEFESHRRYYSIKTTDAEIVLTWASNDNFQTVTQINGSNLYTLHVVAQDGVSTSDYQIEVYRENASSDVTLSNILLDSQTFENFEHAINTDLSFSSMQQRYNINLPSGTLYLPEVSALLNSEGQVVEIETNHAEQIIMIHVTAPNGVSTNTYTLRFFVPKSSNAHLEMIYVGTDSLDGFAPDRYNYFIDLPIGQSTMPEIYPTPQEGTQSIQDSITGPLQHTIYVTAEDGTVQQYMLVFQRTYSNADTLLAIYADGQLIEGFEPDSFYYAYTLPVGSEYMPELSWQEADAWQTVTSKKQYESSLMQITQIEVVAGSGKKNTYTISYQILQSDINSLQTIYIGADALEGFDANTLEYYIHLNPGDSVAPEVTWTTGDNYQTVTPSTVPYTINGAQIGWKTILTVQAQNGHSRNYVVYFLFVKEASNNTELLNIYLNGEPMSDFNTTTYLYRVTVPLGEQRPAVLVTGAEPEQTIQIAHGDTTNIIVTAEDQTTIDTYTIIFTYQRSPYAYLAGIYQDGALIEGFQTDSLEYRIILPYGTTTLPTFTYEQGIEGQQIDIDTIVSTNSNGQPITCYSFIVTAPNQEVSVQYDVFISIALNDDCSLRTLLINGEEISGFHADTTTYEIVYPIGTDSIALITIDDISAIANDPNATVTISNDEHTLTIIVTAEDGLHSCVYTISQTILLSDNNRLKAIYLDSILIRDFDADILEYTYYITDAAPTITAIAEDSTATIEYGMYVANEPFQIYVTAADGTECIYTIHLLASTIQSSQAPSKNDVIIKHIAGTLDFAVATIRKNVSVGIYTAEGHLVYYSKLTETNQNDAIMGVGADGTEILLDTYTTTTQFSVPQAGKVFFYVFYENDKRRIASGKIVVNM